MSVKISKSRLEANTFLNKAREMAINIDRLYSEEEIINLIKDERKDCSSYVKRLINNPTTRAPSLKHLIKAGKEVREYRINMMPLFQKIKELMKFETSESHDKVENLYNKHEELWENTLGIPEVAEKRSAQHLKLKRKKYGNMFYEIESTLKKKGVTFDKSLFRYYDFYLLGVGNPRYYSDLIQE